MNTMHSFGHFHFTAFHKTWQEYMNQCAHESMRSEVILQNIVNSFCRDVVKASF